MRRRIVLSAAVLAVASLAVLPSSGARAVTTVTLSPVTLPLSGYYQMAVDSTNDRLFFSQGRSTGNTILVTGFSGNTVTTITGQTGVTGIALSPDGSTLYAALSGADAVSAISTATLQQTARYPLPAGDVPYSVAVQSGKLWVSYSNPAGDVVAIGDFDLSAANSAFEAQAAMGGGDSPWPPNVPTLAADPSGTGNVLVAVQAGLIPAPVTSYDTGVDPVTVRAHKLMLTSPTGSCGNAQDLAIVPGGAQFIPSCEIDSKHYWAYSTADLSEQGSYPTPTSQDPMNAIAIASGTGLVAAGVASDPAGDIYVFAPGGGKPLNVFSAGYGNLVPRGLGLTPDGSELFAVTKNRNGYNLYVYDKPALPRAPLTVSATASTTVFGTAIHVTAHLGTTATNRTVTVYAQPSGGTSVPLRTGTVNSAGNLTVSYTVARTTTFSAVFTGDAKYAPAAVSVTVKVAARVTASISGYYGSKKIGSVTYRLYHHTAHLDVTAVVAPKKPGGCAKLEIDEYYGGAWNRGTLSGCIPLSPASTISGYLTLGKADRGYKYRLRVDYVPGSNPGNLGAHSPWQHFMVEK